MKKHVVILLLNVLTVTACHRRYALHEASDKDLTVQVMEMAPVPGEGSSVSYKARLIPAATVKEGKEVTGTVERWYRADSCFYLQSGNRKIYPAMIQPVANGIKGSFEYLIDFEPDNQGNASYDLVYQDRFLTHHKYQIKMKD